MDKTVEKWANDINRHLKKVETQIQTFENPLNLNNTQKISEKELQISITILHPLNGKGNLKNLKIPF